MYSNISFYESEVTWSETQKQSAHTLDITYVILYSEQKVAGQGDVSYKERPV